MLKRKLRAALVGSILLACTADVPAIANGLSLNGTEVQQYNMKDNKMGQDKMQSNKKQYERHSKSFDFRCAEKGSARQRSALDPAACAGNAHSIFLALKETPLSRTKRTLGISRVLKPSE